MTTDTYLLALVACFGLMIAAIIELNKSKGIIKKIKTLICWSALVISIIAIMFISYIYFRGLYTNESSPVNDSTVSGPDNIITKDTLSDSDNATTDNSPIQINNMNKEMDAQNTDAQNAYTKWENGTATAEDMDCIISYVLNNCNMSLNKMKNNSSIKTYFYVNSQSGHVFTSLGNLCTVIADVIMTNKEYNTGGEWYISYESNEENYYLYIAQEYIS